MRIRNLVLTMMLLGAAGAAQAEELTGTLKKIKDDGVIIVGHRESSVPFSYYDNQQKVVGYSQDYSNLIVEAVKKKLDMPNLQIKLIPVTSQNRIHCYKMGLMISNVVPLAITLSVKNKPLSLIPSLLLVLVC